jgi:hypothetical protein
MMMMMMMMMPLVKTPDSSAKALWQSYQQIHLGASSGINEGVRILLISIFFTSADLLHAVKSYNMDLRLYFPSEGRCAADFCRP